MLQYTLNVKNFSLNVLEKKGNGLTLIFVHGNSMSSKIWQKQFASDVLASYRLLAFDLPGHGDSAPAADPEEYNVLSYGSILAEFIEKTNAENVVLVGHSLGTNVVIEALPLIGTCKGIVLLAPSLVHNASEVAATFLPNPSIPSFFAADYTEADVQNFVTAISSKTGPALPAFVADDFRKTDKNCRSFLAKSVGENKLSDELSLLQKSTLRILLSVGEEDQLCSREYLQKISLPIWQNQIMLIKKAGHVAQFDNGDDFSTTVLSFCQSII